MSDLIPFNTWSQERIDKMLDDCIHRMKQPTAQMILSIYWAMHEHDNQLVDSRRK